MRNLGLDILRIVAVLLVLGRHLNIPADANVVLRLWQRGGWVGVDLFFVLSGFLVSSLIFREQKRNGEVDFKRFLIRRGFKIYPAFWFFLVVSLCVKFLLESPPTVQQMMGELLFMQNYLGGVWNHTWSLAIEEHFYLALAALFACWTWLKPKHEFSAVPVIFIVVCLLCLSFRLLNLVLFPDFSYQVYLFPTHIRIDSLFFGVLLSYFYAFHQAEEKLAFVPSWFFFVMGVLLLSPAFIFQLESNKWIPTVGVILFYLGSGCILMGALRFPESNSLPLKCLGLLGAASYSIYLWHMPVATWGWRIVKKFSGLDDFLSYFCVYVFGSCLFGLAMSRVVEFPILRIRELFFPSAIQANSGKSDDSMTSIAENAKGPVQLQVD